MLQRVSSFIGGVVLALAIVFGGMYLILGNWSADGLRTALNVEKAVPTQPPAPPVPVPH
jgi:hypothetical protein